MQTTVALKKETMEMLKTVKKEVNAKSFDQVIQILIVKTKKPKKSYFGAFPGLGEFKREEIDRFD